jgi:hypothetical protein
MAEETEFILINILLILQTESYSSLRIHLLAATSGLKNETNTRK